MKKKIPICSNEAHGSIKKRGPFTDPRVAIAQIFSQPAGVEKIAIAKQPAKL
jgi:hypothetical protein